MSASTPADFNLIAGSRGVFTDAVKDVIPLRADFHTLQDNMQRYAKSLAISDMMVAATRALIANDYKDRTIGDGPFQSRVFGNMGFDVTNGKNSNYDLGVVAEGLTGRISFKPTPSSAVKNWTKTAQSLQQAGVGVALAFHLGYASALSSGAYNPSYLTHEMRQTFLEKQIERIKVCAGELGIYKVTVDDLVVAHLVKNDLPQKFLEKSERILNAHAMVLTRFAREMSLRGEVLSAQEKCAAAGIRVSGPRPA